MENKEFFWSGDQEKMLGDFGKRKLVTLTLDELEVVLAFCDHITVNDLYSWITPHMEERKNEKTR